MADTITINDIHIDTKKMDVTVTIEGQNYSKVVPLIDTEDEQDLTNQLKALAAEFKQEREEMKAEGSTANVSDAVKNLVGQPIPLDESGTTTQTSDQGTTVPSSSTTVTPGAADTGNLPNSAEQQAGDADGNANPTADQAK